jgi:hypothetical protein
VVPVASKLTLAVLAALLGWSSPRPPDFWSGLGNADERAFQTALRTCLSAVDAHDLASAQGAARRAAETRPDRFEGHLLFALISEELGQPEAAPAFSRAITLDDRFLMHLLGADYASSAFARAADFPRAAEIACDAARRAPPSPTRVELFERCGAALMAAGPEHLEAARRALELGEPERPSPRYVMVLALAFDRAGAHDHALVVLRPLGTRPLDEHTASFMVGSEEDRAAAEGLLAEALHRTREATNAYERAAARGPWAEHARTAGARLLTRISPVVTPAPRPRRR